MIVPMKKYSMLIYHRELDKCLDSLKDLGLVHIIEQEKDAVPEVLTRLYNSVSSLESLIKELKKLVTDKKIEALSAAVTLAPEKVEELQQEFYTAKKKIEEDKGLIKHLEKEISYLEPWGDFSPESIEEINDFGVEFKLYQTSESKFQDAWKQNLPITVVNTSGGQVYFTVHHLASEVVDLAELETEAELIALPEKSISDLKKEIRELNGDIIENTNRLVLFTKENLNSLVQYQIEVQEGLNTEEARSNTLDSLEGKLKVVEGWIPEENEKELLAYLDKESIVFETETPGKEDNSVPIKLKNGKFATLFEPISKLFSLPAYQEIDLTPLFAPFFMFFFGFCLGDAGYGAVVLIAATIAKMKVSKNLKSAMALLQFLGLSTIVMGFAGGTVFGVSLIEDESTTKFLTTQNLFFFSVIVGIVQILFGMFVKAFNMIKQKGHIYALSTYGWILMTIALVGMGAGKLLTDFGGYPVEMVEKITILGPIGEIATPVFFVGLALLLLFNNPDLNIFKRFGLGLWEFYGITGLLGDVLSYLRLYALGLSSGILGLVINNLGNELILEAIPVPGLNYLIFVIFLVLAHTGNLALAFLGSFVHPMRLTFVEFYKNAGWEGGGFEFKPFKKVQQ